MNVFVTGGTGFVGRYLIRELSRQGHRVLCLTRSTSDRSGLDRLPNVTFATGDVCDPESLRGITRDIDVVYHLAAKGHISAISEEAFREFVAINASGTQNLLEECARTGVKKFIHFSSTAAMGLIKKKLVDERDTPRPKTPYQKSKLASEKVALSYSTSGRVPVVILRPCMIYGVGGKGEFYKMYQLIRKGLFPRVGLGRNLTPLVHVSDVVQAALAAAERGNPGETYLVTSSRSFELAEIRRAILAALRTNKVYFYIPTPLMYLAACCLERLAAMTGNAPLVTVRNIASTVWDREFSVKKAEEQLGYLPQVGLSAVEEVVRWFERSRSPGRSPVYTLRQKEASIEP